MRILAVFLCLISGSCLASDMTVRNHNLPDSLLIEKIEVEKSGQVAVRMELVNSEDLGAVTIPLIIRGEGTKFDSVSFVGSRLEYLATRPVTITGQGRMVIFGAICITEDYIAPGRGLLATLYVDIPDSLENKPIIIDSVTVHPASLLFTRSNSASYLPQFVPGSISVVKSTDKQKSED
jgi:hypothetical protein